MSRDFPKKVFVGLSGGVDSSVSAALLKKDGYAVTGVFIRVWNPASEQSPTLNREKGRTLFGLCEAAEDRLDAMRVCAKLNIPFVELNLEKEYKKEVVDYMIREYKAGKTPNPDVFCNRFIKFGGFYEFARKSGADFIATGHYARIVKRYERYEHQILGNENLMLVASADRNKDQSYFLWQIKKEQLPNILFPVGGMRKPEVRRLAKRFGLITADKKDSQGLCFVGKVDMKEFLSHYIKPRKGKVLDENGRVVGEHSGAFFYTIGERIAVSPPPSLEGG
ncbi:MAG TPA: tRNA 2-thiouridine(34) synthase MnmA, partial [Candidatus Paceibacterota bacterium]